MKVVILGPAVNEKTSGGVAVFDEDLYHGFVENGDEVFLISANKSLKINNFLIAKNEVKPSKVFFHFKKISKILEQISPDLVISSLQYSIGIKKYKKCCKNTKFIHILHGFPCEINGKNKANLVNFSSRYCRKHFDFLVTVSFLSYAINKKIECVKCDKVIYNGSNFLPSKQASEKEFDFVYVGRLFRDKEVDMIVDAFLFAKKKNQSLKFAIAGYGELETKIKDKKYLDSGIDFLGKLNQEQVRDIFSKSRYFISMNPLEPFGIVFCEALLSGCNIITQSTAGCASLFIKKDYYHIADCLNAEELSEKLLEITNEFHKITEEEMNEIVEYASYKRVSKEYKELIAKNE